MNVAPLLDQPSSAERKKPVVTINIARFWRGATLDEIVDTLLPDLKPYFNFVAASAPQVMLYGPYEGPPPSGRAVTVFIGCENVRPLMDECDWAFGVEHEEYVGHPRYMRFARWGDDSHLVQKDRDWDAVLREKTRFCAFIYANPVLYREAFCQALSRYKPVDAPGRSMNNMPSIDPVPGTVDWAAKVRFLRQYKFVIAFENSSRPGYNTEKLIHPIEADSLPIYWGDPEVGRSFNTARFINAHDYLPRRHRPLPRLPYARHSIHARLNPTFAERAARRVNNALSRVEQRMWARRGFDALIERIIELDRDDELYLQHLRQPFLIDNTPPDRTRWIARWREIFTAATRRPV